MHEILSALEPFQAMWSDRKLYVTTRRLEVRIGDDLKVWEAANGWKTGRFIHCRVSHVEPEGDNQVILAVIKIAQGNRAHQSAYQ